MIRNLKALGLALVALFAMSAIAASSASAHNITVYNNVYPVSLIGEDVGEPDLLTLGANSINCHGETYSATLNAASTTIETTPEYGDTCQTVGTEPWNVTVTENGCKLHFEWDSHVATDHDKVKVKVVCPIHNPGKPNEEKTVLEIHHFKKGTAHTIANSTCTNTVHTQSTTGTLTATSITETATTGDILLEGSVGVVTTTHGECSANFTLSVNSTFDATTTVKAADGRRIHIE